MDDEDVSEALLVAESSEEVQNHDFYTFAADGLGTFGHRLLDLTPQVFERVIAGGRCRRRSVFGLPTFTASCAPYRCWCLFMLLLDLTYTAFAFPYIIAIGGLGLQDWATVLEMLAGVAFAIDLFLGFHASFAVRCRGSRAQVLDGRDIAMLYVRHSWSFWLALLAAAPLVGELAYLTLAGNYHDSVLPLDLLTLVRAVRVSRVLLLLRDLGSGKVVVMRRGRFTNVGVSSVGLLIFSNLYCIAVFINLLACMWMYIGRQEVEMGVPGWMPSVSGSDLSDAPAWVQYLTSVYFTVMTMTTVGYGDIVPQNVSERLAAIVCMMGGAVFLTFLISTVVSLWSGSTRHALQRTQLRDMLQALDWWLTDSPLQERTRRRVYHYFTNEWAQDEVANALWAKCIREMSRSVRRRVVAELADSVMTNARLLEGLAPEICNALHHSMQPRITQPDRDIFLQGEEVEGFWFLPRGTVMLQHNCADVAHVSAPALVSGGDPAMSALLHSWARDGPGQGDSTPLGNQNSNTPLGNPKSVSHHGGKTFISPRGEEISDCQPTKVVAPTSKGAKGAGNGGDWVDNNVITKGPGVSVPDVADIGPRAGDGKGGPGSGLGNGPGPDPGSGAGIGPGSEDGLCHSVSAYSTSSCVLWLLPLTQLRVLCAASPQLLRNLQRACSDSLAPVGSTGGECAACVPPPLGGCGAASAAHAIRHGRGGLPPLPRRSTPSPSILGSPSFSGLLPL